jgi:hypothetical protein
VDLPDKQSTKPIQKSLKSFRQDYVDKLSTNYAAPFVVDGNNPSSHTQFASFHEFTNQIAFEWAQGGGPFAKPLAETSLFQGDDDSTLLRVLVERGFTDLTIADIKKTQSPRRVRDRIAHDG